MDSSTVTTPEQEQGDRYQVTYLPISKIMPSPENDEVYGAIEDDEQMDALVQSIQDRGLEEPLILTADYYILSGHRRYYALQQLGEDVVPVRIKSDIIREDTDDFHHQLIDFNPQRIKRAGSLLKEALLRNASGEDTYQTIQEFRRASEEVDVEFMTVKGVKSVSQITDKKRPFLDAVKGVINSLQKHWPLSIRQIHYRLLNDPPLTSTPKRSKFDVEKYRYRNDKACYGALVRLLTSARYNGEVSMTCIDDPTRPQVTYWGWSDVGEFVQNEINAFLAGYSRDLLQDQPRHIEVFGEKSTLKLILEKACQEYQVSLSIGRGFCSIPVWRDIAKRFKQSGKKKMTLIIVSDYDPEGLELADDAIRSLKQLWKLPVVGHRVAVTREQIDDLGLAEDFSPAKSESSRFDKFVERTGGEETWEVESLSPDYLIEQVRAAIEANLDMELFEATLEQEREDCDELSEIKEQIAGELKLW